MFYFALFNWQRSSGCRLFYSRCFPTDFVLPSGRALVPDSAFAVADLTTTPPAELKQPGQLSVHILLSRFVSYGAAGWCFRSSMIASRTPFTIDSFTFPAFGPVFNN